MGKGAKRRAHVFILVSRDRVGFAELVIGPGHFWPHPLAQLTPRLPGLRAAHEEAFLDDLTVADGVKADLIEVHAFLAFGRDI